MSRVWPWVALALAAGVGLQQLRVAGLQVDLAKFEASAAKTGQEQAQQSQVATENKAGALLEHASDTQGNIYEYTQTIQLLAAGRAADAGRITGLQHDLRAASTQHAQAASDLAACRNLGDRHQELGELAARSAGVIGGAIGLVQQRDAEVTLLKKQVLTERGLVDALTKGGSR